MEPKILEARKRQVEDLERSNEHTYQELLSATNGRYAMDTGDMRRELLIEKLAEWGIVSEEQVVEFNLVFHLKVETALKQAFENLREKKMESRKPKLIGLDGRPL